MFSPRVITFDCHSNTGVSRVSKKAISKVILKPRHRAASGSCSFKDFVLAGSKKALFSFQNIETKQELRYMPGACDDVM